MSEKLEKGLEVLRAEVDSKVKSFFSSCVNCGICAEACLFYTETNDPRYTPIYKTEPLRKLWRNEYSLWGKISSALGMSKPMTEADFTDWEELVYDGCSMCGRCSMVCPVGVDISGMIFKVWRDPARGRYRQPDGYYDEGRNGDHQACRGKYRVENSDGCRGRRLHGAAFFERDRALSRVYRIAG
jgi:Fe-S oxidoreductase